MEPELRVEVVGFDVRAFGTLSSHTIYVIRFMIPSYHDDQLYFMEDLQEEDVMTNMKMSNKKHLMLNSSNSTNPSVKSGDSEKSRKTPKIYCLNQKI